MSTMTDSKTPTITDRIIDYLRSNPGRGGKEIAEAIGEKVNSIASLCSQLETRGKLKRTLQNIPKADGTDSNMVRSLYEIGDLSSTITYRPKKKRQTPLAEAMANELEADAHTRAILERARNGHRQPTIAEKLDDALGDDLSGDSSPSAEKEADRTDTAYPTEKQLELAAMVSEKERLDTEIAREQMRAELLAELRPQIRREVIAEIQQAAPQSMPAVPVEPPPPQPAPNRDGAEVQIPEEVEARHAEFSTLVPIHRLMDTIAKTMARELMTRLHVELTGEVSTMAERLKSQVEMASPSPEQLAARVANAVQPIRKRLTTVLIIGLLPDQAGMISKEFSDCFDLRFWKNEAMEMLKHNARNAEYTITFTSKIGHSAEEMLKSMNLPIIRCSGGMSMLRNKLTELFIRISDAQQAA